MFVCHCHLYRWHSKLSQIINQIEISGQLLQVWKRITNFPQIFWSTIVEFFIRSSEKSLFYIGLRYILFLPSDWMYVNKKQKLINHL